MVTKLIALATLLVAGQALRSQAAPDTIKAKDFSQLKSLLEQRKSKPLTQLYGEEFRAEEAKGDFRQANLKGANLASADLTFINLQGADLTNANLSASTLIGTDFTKATLINANFSNVITKKEAYQPRFDGANLTKANFTSATLEQGNFRQANLTEANFTRANLENVGFSDVNLTKVNFSGANLTRAQFNQCTGFETIILDNKTNFQDVSGLTIEQNAYVRSKGALNVPVETRGTDTLKLMQLLEKRKTDPNAPIQMQGANLTEVSLENVNLKDANFAQANLTKAYMNKVTLTGVNLSGTNLTQTLFSDCIDFKSTIIDNKTVLYKVLGLSDEDLAYARSKGALQVAGKDVEPLRRLMGERERSLSKEFQVNNLSVESWQPELSKRVIQMPNADLQYARIPSLEYMNLSGSNLTGAFLEYAQLMQTYLSGTTLDLVK